MPQMKICSRCSIQKTQDMFSKKNARCKACISDINKANYRKNIEANRERTRQWRLKNPDKQNDLARRRKESGKKDADYKRWRERNIDSCRKRRKLDYAKNREREISGMRAWKRENADKIREYMLEYWKTDSFKARNRANATFRNKIRKIATPSWADLKAIRAIYLECARISRETGIPHEVDHIVPITSPYVCGLHCEANLRIITKEENRKKKNSFSPG